MVAYINALQLISEVRKRPIVWDTSAEEYKDRVKKAESWLEICGALFEDYDEKSAADQMNLEREVHGRWKSIRDCYTKDSKKVAITNSQGHRVKTSRRYIFSKQLGFLKKVMKAKPSMNALSSPEYSDEESEDISNIPKTSVKGQPSPSNKRTRDRTPTNEEAKPTLDKRKRAPCFQIIRNRERGKSLTLEDRISQLINEHNSQERDEDKDFFMSMLPSVHRLNEDQKLEFRVQVLLALKNVKAGQHSSQMQLAQSSNPCVFIHHNQNGHSDPVDPSRTTQGSEETSPTAGNSPSIHAADTKDFHTSGLWGKDLDLS